MDEPDSVQPAAKAERKGLGSTRRHWLGAASLALSSPVSFWVSGASPGSPRDRLGVVGLLATSEGHFERALVPRRFLFPADHLPHREFRTEWWYFTGYGLDEKKRQYGFQWTLFRQGLSHDPSGDLSPDSSAWRASEAWMAHIAITDVAKQQHLYAQRLDRGALGLAGNELLPSGEVRFWVGETQALMSPGGNRWRFSCNDREHRFGFALDAEATRTPLLHGDGGLSRKGEDAASYYYSLPSLRLSGDVHLDSDRHFVRGHGWLDREWSTTELAPGQLGWDWLALMLVDGRELMLFQLRRRDHRRDSFDAGTLRNLDGSVTHLRAHDFAMTPVRFWVDGNVRWPVEWRISLTPSGSRLNLIVKAAVADQRMRLLVDYWEGLVEAWDESGGIVARGYLEMTGYAE